MTKLDTLLEKIDKSCNELSDRLYEYMHKRSCGLCGTDPQKIKSFLHQAIMEAYQLGKKEGIEVIGNEVIGDSDEEFIEWRKYVNDFYKQKKEGLVLHYPAWLEEKQRMRLSQLVEGGEKMKKKFYDRGMAIEMMYDLLKQGFSHIQLHLTRDGELIITCSTVAPHDDLFPEIDGDFADDWTITQGKENAPWKSQFWWQFD